MTRDEFRPITAAILALWPRSAWPEATINIAYPLLLDFEADHVNKAIVNLCREGREFAPPPGVVYVYADAIKREQREHQPRLPEASNWELGRRRIRQMVADLAESMSRKQMTEIGRPK